MIIADPAKLRKYKKENKLKDNRLHKKARQKARKIANHFHLKLIEEAIFNPYILDLYIDKARIGLEIDGSIHKKTENYDERRDRYLAEQYGIMVLRFVPDDIKEGGMFKRVVWECCWRWFIAHIKEIKAYAYQVKQENTIPFELRDI